MIVTLPGSIVSSVRTTATAKMQYKNSKHFKLQKYFRPPLTSIVVTLSVEESDITLEQI